MFMGGAGQWEPPGDGWPKSGVRHRCTASHPAVALRHCPMLTGGTGWAARIPASFCKLMSLWVPSPLPPPHPIASIILGEKTQPSAPLGRAAPLRNVSCSEEDFSGSALVQQKCWRSLVHHSVPKHTRTAPTPARLLLGVRPIGTLWGGPGLSLHSKSHFVPAASFIFLGSPCPAPSNLISLEIPHPLLSARSFST